MPLVDSFEKQGNFLFKHRGQLPVLFFFISIPFIFLSSEINLFFQFVYNIISVSLTIIGLIIRFYTIGTTPKGTSGRNTNKQIAEYLNSSGIYSIVRNPLYLGNYFIWLGIAFFTYNLYFIIIFTLLFWLYYERIIFAEERFLEKKFGSKYLNWSSETPVFIPSFKRFKKSSLSFSFKSILRREYAGMLATVVSFSFVEIVRTYFLTNSLNMSPIIFKILIFVSLVVFILRYIKHNTNILDETDRS
tara:strand:- start:100 stop:837 length:738 start_codon:yes stop_codon:yes gene_type:complete